MVGYLAIFLMAIVIIIAIGSLVLVGTTAVAKVVERFRRSPSD